MSRTPETVTNKFAEFCRNVLLAIGGFFTLVTLINTANGGNVVLPAVIAIAVFILAAKLKVHWRKKAEVGVYK
jgi:hypothetical protein